MARPFTARMSTRCSSGAGWEWSFSGPNLPEVDFENVAYGLRIAGVNERASSRGRVERALRHAALWEEVKDRLSESGWPLGRTAAAAVHCSCARGRARSAAHGRACERARSDRDRKGRGPRRRAPRRADHRHRDAQHAAGGTRVSAHRLFFTWVGSSKSATPPTFHTPQRAGDRGLHHGAIRLSACTNRLT